MIEGTLGSIARDAPTEVEMKAGLKRIETGDANTGRLSNRQATAFNSCNKEKEQVGMSVQLHDNDIKIVTLPPKERIQVLDQKNRKDLHLIQS